MTHARRCGGYGLVFFLGLALSGCAALSPPNPLFDVQGIHAAAPAAYASRILENVEIRTPVSYLPELPTREEAENIRTMFLSYQMQEFGPPVGYKAGLTNRTLQAQFDVNQPVLGVLLTGMLLPSGTTIPARFGARSMVEGDLLVRVKDASINQATTAREALAGLDAVIPFMELPDLVYKQGGTINGPAITAINAGARYGVTGSLIGLEDTPEWMDRLARFSVHLTDDTGAVLGQGTGKDILEHPLNAVLWIKDELNRMGARLKPGDLLSLGTLTPLVPPVAGRTFTARYEGLDPRGPVSVSVQFIK